MDNRPGASGSGGARWQAGAASRRWESARQVRPAEAKEDPERVQMLCLPQVCVPRGGAVSYERGTPVAVGVPSGP